MFRIGAQRFKNQFGAMEKSLKNSQRRPSCFCSPPPSSAARPLSQESRRPLVVCQTYREAGGSMWHLPKSAHSTAEAPAWPRQSTLWNVLLSVSSASPVSVSIASTRRRCSWGRPGAGGAEGTSRHPKPDPLAVRSLEAGPAPRQAQPKPPIWHFYKLR